MAHSARLTAGPEHRPEVLVGPRAIHGAETKPQNRRACTPHTRDSDMPTVVGVPERTLLIVCRELPGSDQGAGWDGVCRSLSGTVSPRRSRSGLDLVHADTVASDARIGRTKRESRVLSPRDFWIVKCGLPTTA